MGRVSVRDVAARARKAPARCGRTRVVLIDGPAGSGKTMLGERLGAELGAQVIHGDDIYEGWDGLATMWPILGHGVLEPLSRGEHGAFGRWDWVEGRRAETIPVPVADALVVEGVGVAQRAAREFASLVLYVEAPFELRLQRGIARDGEELRAEWERWQPREEIFLADEGVRGAADLIVDGTQPYLD
ncbi:uridine kinase family protein [Demequina zhanjiangensis]|uniref:Uridine kinase n=1 Tax=Demequina zhanjiangensis TaxID=3051659 RepID=A0ABT8G3P5_9MICO|nr:uridine kinase [Demequina sp. SYSU T00b26]MDN4473777.1 uridine kinase [Demequina sp. SYSU T00b26]